MSFRWKVTYYPVTLSGIRLTWKPVTGFVRARTREQAEAKARNKFGSKCEIVSVD